MEGSTEEAVCHLQAVGPTPDTTRLAVKPRNIPKASKSCQFMTSEPRICAGLTSAAKTGTTLALQPIPMPRMARQASSCRQLCEHALPIIAARIRAPDNAMAGRRPKKYSLMGSLNQQPIKQAERYGTALTTAKIQASRPGGCQCVSHKALSRQTHRWDRNPQRQQDPTV